MAEQGTIFVRPRRVRDRIAIATHFWAYLMIAPTLLGLGVFHVYPVFKTLYLSMTKSGDFGKTTWYGLGNYAQLFRDPLVHQSFINTVVYVGLFVPISMIASIIVAVLLNQKIRGRGVYRTLYFLPVVTAPAAVSMVWKWLYNGSYGLINEILSILHIQGPDWISDPHIALFSVVMVGVWSVIGYNMVILLAGLQGIPTQYYEAAVMDGASGFVRFLRITIPLLTPTIFFLTLISLINAFQVFDYIYMMVGPTSPAISNTESLVYLFFNYAFVANNQSYAATIATGLFVVILIITIIQMYFQKRWVHYQ